VNVLQSLADRTNGCAYVIV